MRKFLVFFTFFALFQNNIFSQELNKKTLIVYGSDECHHCIDTKTFLVKNKIEFVFFDIDKNPEALKEMLNKLRNAGISTSNLGIPVIDKNGVIFSNNAIFEEFLEKLK